MKSLAILILVAAATTLFADTFTIERNDPRPFRIHRGPDETAATKAMIDELAREVKRVTGVSTAIIGYDTAMCLSSCRHCTTAARTLSSRGTVRGSGAFGTISRRGPRSASTSTSASSALAKARAGRGPNHRTSSRSNLKAGP